MKYHVFTFHPGRFADFRTYTAETLPEDVQAVVVESPDSHEWTMPDGRVVEAFEDEDEDSNNTKG